MSFADQLRFNLYIGKQKLFFEDNIRDYLGPNQDVNESICKAILSGDVNAFSMLNNGVTIVASTISIPGDIATIEDYQIVNGCQTSNILIDNMDVAENIDELIIPVRIIATKDENLKNEITKATNSQTEIKKEQLEALSTFQKNLEEFYKTFTSQDFLVYERRTGQYGAVVKRFGKIFKSTDKPIVYYTSALALYKIENLLKQIKLTRNIDAADIMP